MFVAPAFQRLGQLWAGDRHLDDAQRERMRAHVYRSVDASLLDKYVMHRFWNALVRLYPLWLASNVLTLGGLLLNIVGALPLLSQGLSSAELVPRSHFAIAALTLFLYQTLDATDGKQSYRTHQSTPLEELFDHGLDAISNVLITVNTCYALRLGTEGGVAVLVVFVASALLFYSAQWSVFCSGVVKFSRFDLTEAQCLLIGLFAVTAARGQALWDVAFFGVQLRKWLLLLCAFSYCLKLSDYLRDCCQKRPSTSMRPLLPFLGTALSLCLFYANSADRKALDANVVLVCLFHGSLFAKVTIRLLVAHMSHTAESPLLDPCLVFPLPLALNQLLGTPLNEMALLGTVTTLSTVSLVAYFVRMCREICSIFEIECFRLKRVYREDDAPSYLTGSYN